MASNTVYPTAAARLVRAGLAVAALGALAACANMNNIPAGTSLAQVEAQFGRPNFSCPDQAGGRHLIWTQQPMGQYAWGTHVDGAGQIGRVTPLLTDAHFRILAKGTWTQDQVRCEFGPPAIIDSVGMPSVSQHVWSYRYRENGVWNSLMYVYFGHDGSHVTRFHPGPDPMYEVHDTPL